MPPTTPPTGRSRPPCAPTMSALSTVQDALGLGAATVDVAYTGVEQRHRVVDQIKSKLVAARQPGVDKTKSRAKSPSCRRSCSGIADVGHRSRARTGCRSNSGAPATTPPRHRRRRSRAPAARSSIGTIASIRRHQAVRRRRPVAASSTASTTTNGARGLLGRPAPLDGSRHLGADRQRRRPRDLDR